MRAFLFRVLLFVLLAGTTSSALALLAVGGLPPSGRAMRATPGYPDNFLFNNLGWRKYAFTERVFKELPGVRELDILFLGSSHFYSAFDPRFFAEHGIRSFNLATPSQTPFHSHHLLAGCGRDLYLRLVVVDVFGTLLDHRRAEGNLDLIRNAPMSPSLVAMAAGSGDSRSWRSTWLRLHDPRAFMQIAAPTDESSPENATERYVPGGYLDSTAVWDGELAEQTGSLAVSRFQLAWLRQIARQCRSRRLPVLLVQTPVTPAYREAVPGIAELAGELAGLCAEEGVEFLDFSAMPDLESDQLYRDSHHLNSTGARLFLPAFLAALTERGLP